MPSQIIFNVTVLENKTNVPFYISKNICHCDVSAALDFVNIK